MASNHLNDWRAIEGREAVLDELGAAEPQVLAAAEAVQRLHRCLARREAATTRAIAAFDAPGAWEASGAGPRHRGPPAAA